jgi:hypothetical protein
MRALIALVLPCAAIATGPDFLLVSTNEAEAIREAIARRDPAIAEPADRLRRAADGAMKAGPWSVTLHRPKNTPAGLHDFFSEGPYWWPDPDNPGGPYIRRDGEVNPDRIVENDKHLDDLGEAVLRLGPQRTSSMSRGMPLVPRS